MQFNHDANNIFEAVGIKKDEFSGVLSELVCKLDILAENENDFIEYMSSGTDKEILAKATAMVIVLRNVADMIDEEIVKYPPEVSYCIGFIDGIKNLIGKPSQIVECVFHTLKHRPKESNYVYNLFISINVLLTYLSGNKDGLIDITVN